MFHPERCQPIALIVRPESASPPNGRRSVTRQRSRSIHRLSPAVPFLIGLLLLAANVMAQTPQGRLIVEVVDPGGDVLPGATVIVMRAGEPRGTAITDGTGHATFATLPAGSYTVTASLPGFRDGAPATARLRDRADTHTTVRLGPPAFDETVTVGASRGAPPPEVSIGKSDLPDLPPDPDVLQSTIDALGGVGATLRVDGLTSGGLPPATAFVGSTGKRHIVLSVPPLGAPMK